MLNALVVATLTSGVHNELSKALNVAHNPVGSRQTQDILPASEILIIEDLLVLRRFRNFRAVGHIHNWEGCGIKKKCENPIRAIQRTSGFEAPRCWGISVFGRASNPHMRFSPHFFTRHRPEVCNKPPHTTAFRL